MPSRTLPLSPALHPSLCAGQPAALQYARAHLGGFRATHLPQIQRLMGAMCFVKRACAGGGGNPYADLFSADLWSDLGREFVRQSCALLGQGQDSPLLVALAAGSAALPTLLKLASVVLANPAAELAGQANQLPVEIALGKEFVFRSVFACPVSREQVRRLLCLDALCRPCGGDDRLTSCPSPPFSIPAEHPRQPPHDAALRPLHVQAEHPEDCQGGEPGVQVPLLPPGGDRAAVPPACAARHGVTAGGRPAAAGSVYVGT